VLTSAMRPANDRELAAILLEASETRTPLEVMGAGSKAMLGHAVQAEASLSSRAMRGVTLYEPTELVMSARAGTPLVQIESELARNRQMLAFEPIDPAGVLGGEPGAATIGGVFATNLSGSRRVQVGAARDHLLGVAAVTGAGEPMRAGGRVMKNVTGLDLCRLLAGSWGTLAVMTEVTFKVLPEPEQTCTLVYFGLSDDIAGELLCQAMGTPYEVSGAVHIQAAMTPRLGHEGLASYGKSITALRLETFERFLRYRRSKLIEQLAVYGDPAELEQEASLDFWGDLRRLGMLRDATAPLWRISAAPSKGPTIAAQIASYMDTRVVYDWSGGLLWAEVLETADAGAADIRRVVTSHGGHATLVRAKPATRAVVDVFHPRERPLQRLERGLKSTFDPAGILNPGRIELTGVA
jgi:glycolate oxidase FAD binding subunit